MRVSIDVKDKAEADAVRVAMADPETRALVLIVGTLLPHTPRTQKRVLSFVADHVAEQREAASA